MSNSRFCLAVTCLALGFTPGALPAQAPAPGAQAPFSAQSGGVRQPEIGARAKNVLTVDGLRFKDANGTGALDPYEDWRLGADVRARDLVSRMTLDEKAGMMLIDTLNPGVGGLVTDTAGRYINEQKMTRFIFRSVVTATPVASTRPGFGGQQVTPEQAATWTNKVQEMAEST